ncbi:agamous-like MADS-box protein AGL82 [Salvia divinorum]|uniref:Agamous-like MADS-box protein AGL82 n=1 Tax=Salvia divinorum TaxID=28513 RepID=A0ABD1GKI1_SALDI
MGRAKLKMELIEKEKSRNTTFKKRKEGLIRKLNEFTTLCDVNACMIIYGPNQGRPEIWPPQNPEQVRRIIELYKSKNSSGIKKISVVNFFKDRKKQIEEELTKLRRKNLEAKYPTRPDLLNVINEPQLRQLHAILTDKADYVRSRIELLRMKQRSPSDHRSHVDFMNPQLEMLVNHPLMHHNSVMMGMASGSTNAANMQLKPQFFYESTSGFYPPSLPHPQYMMPPQQRPYLLQAMVQPQLQVLANQDELVMRNQLARTHNLNQDGVKYEDLTTNRMFSC